MHIYILVQNLILTTRYYTRIATLRTDYLFHHTITLRIRRQGHIVHSSRNTVRYIDAKTKTEKGMEQVRCPLDYGKSVDS